MQGKSEDELQQGKPPAGAAPPALEGGDSASANRFVLITNVANEATGQTLSEFLSFCGKIERIHLSAKADVPSQRAVVEFLDPAAARTALLLGNAVVAGKAISVKPYDEAVDGPKPDGQVDRAELADKGQAPASERTKTSVVAGLLASGYTLGDDTLAKAKAWDEENMVSLSVKAGAANLAARAQEVDEQYQISKTIGAAGAQAAAAAKEVDETYGISATLWSAAAQAKLAASSLAARAMEVPAVAQAAAATGEAATSVSNTVAGVRDETAREIERKKAAKGGAAAGGGGGGESGGAQSDAAATPAPEPSAPPAE